MLTSFLVYEPLDKRIIKIRQIEEGYRMNAEAENFFPVSDPDCVPLENSVLYTAISRKVVAKNLHATIPKGNMGYNQYLSLIHI